MKIAIFLVGRIGDMILSTPMYSAIKKKYPTTEITVIAGRANYSILENNPYIDRIWVFDKNPIKIIPLLFKILFTKFDYWLDPKDHYSSESLLFARLSRANITVGYNRQDNHHFDFSIPSFEDNKHLHYTQRCFNALLPIGINIPKFISTPELYESKEFDEALFSNIISNSKKNILINISATSETRIYPTEKWINVIEAIDNKLNNIIISYVIQQTQIAEDLANRFPNIHIYSSNSILNLISLVKRVDLVISPDTSVVHIASAFNKPLIALFNDVQDNFIRFKPTSNKQKIIMPKDCISVSNISPDNIKDAINSLLF